jgi:hypothetical protein
VYRQSYGSYPGDFGYHLTRSEPWELAAVDFSEYIRAVSKRFCNVFIQALNAEHDSLDEIAGPGYRNELPTGVRFSSAR